MPRYLLESEAGWTEVLMDLKQRGLNKAPRPAAGDSAGILESSSKTPAIASRSATLLGASNISICHDQVRTARTKNCGNQTTTLPMAFKLMEAAQKKWFRLRGLQNYVESGSSDYNFDFHTLLYSSGKTGFLTVFNRVMVERISGCANGSYILRCLWIEIANLTNHLNATQRDGVHD